MKIYKCSKDILKWKEMPQIQYKWILPILVDTDLNVIVGNSLKNSLSETIYIVYTDNNNREVLFQALYEIEEKIALENSIDRLNMIQMELKQFFREVRKPFLETIELFSVREDTCVTPENYIEPPVYNFNKHGKQEALLNDGYLLLEEFLEKPNKEEYDIEIDMEILKELL